jgi:predicted acylesterase/phospholipase RssA
VVRASTAAPGYFRPEPLRIAPGAPPGLFVDGGVSPYNNPSLPLLMMATTRPFGLCWPTSPEALA